MAPRAFIVLLAIALGLGGWGKAMPANAGALANQGQYVCDMLASGQAVNYDSHFTKAFQGVVPRPALDSILGKLKKQFGPCIGWQYKHRLNNYVARIVTQHIHDKLYLDLVIDPGTGRIAHLMTLGAHGDERKSQ